MPDEFEFKQLFYPFTNKKAYLYITIIGVVVYFNALFGNWVWDDISFILMNEELHRFNLPELIGPNVYNGGGYYRMVPAIYVAAIYTTFGPEPIYFHLFQIALHIINGFLVFLFLKKFFTDYLTFFLTLIFLIHPVQTESVSYISSIQSSLFFFFGISALILSTKELLSKKRILLISLGLLLSVLTKETGVLFLAIVFFYQIVLKKKKEIIQFFIYPSVIIVYALIRFGIAGVPFDKNIHHPIGALPLGERLMHIPVLIYYYIKMFFFPANMAINQLWTIKEITFIKYIFPTIITVITIFLIALLGVYLYKKDKKMVRLYLFFTLWIIVGFGLLLQLFPLDMTVADRWMYFPIIGVLGIIAIAYNSFKNSFIKYQKLLFTFSVLIIVALSLRTMVRNADYANALTLYAKDIQIESNHDLHNMLGGVYLSQKQYEPGIYHLKKSIELSPKDSAIFNLGSAYLSMNNKEKAKESFYQLIDNPKIPIRPEVKKSAKLSLAQLLINEENWQETKRISELGIKEFPDEGSFWAYLAISNYNLKNISEALSSAEKAKTLLPNKSTEMLFQRIKDNEPLNLK